MWTGGEVMATTFESISLQGLRVTHLQQLQSYIYAVKAIKMDIGIMVIKNNLKNVIMNLKHGLITLWIMPHQKGLKCQRRKNNANTNYSIPML